MSFLDIWKFWQRHHKAKEIVTLWAACDRYIKYLKRDKVRSYAIHARHILETLCNNLGSNANLEDITRNDLEIFTNNLPYSPVTKKNYRSTLSSSWKYFERQNWVDCNIADKLQIEKIIPKEIGILTVQEAENLMRSNEKVDPEICGLMALGLFAGMRTSAIARVEYNEIDFKAKGIKTPAQKTKKGRYNYIENLPNNLWAWLERTPQTAFNWCERKWKKRREIALRRAGLLVNTHDIKKMQKDRRNHKTANATNNTSMPLEPRYTPHNAFRHSFASYHVALHRNFQDTALIMSHKGTSILFDHYRGIANKEDAQKYFDIYPSS